MTKTIARHVLIILGWISILLGLIGAFLPIMPTVPFLILAAFFFSKSSDRLHKWLLDRPKIGPALKDWETNRIIRKPAKILATIFLLGSIAVGLIFFPWPPWFQIAYPIVVVTVLSFIWTRPSH